MTIPAAFLGITRRSMEKNISSCIFKVVTETAASCYCSLSCGAEFSWSVLFLIFPAVVAWSSLSPVVLSFLLLLPRKNSSSHILI